ncbi:NUDIX hydrolase [Deinococcus altitudinis]|uniref:NUDIX hydrolase n=1 Tax=Deinococcus altitudinis TaxID=468914 RepID=UPI0038924537
MTLPHRQCAAAIVRNPAGQVLLVQQNYGGFAWGAPGGVVEPGETPMQAAVREAAEETGLEVELTHLIGVYLLQGGGWPDILAHVFTAEILSGEEHIVDAGEIARLEWRDLIDLPSPMVTDVEAALADLRAGRQGVVRTVQRTRKLPPLE